MRKNLDHYTGCLLGGAIGDALGEPVEFLSWFEIEREYGGKGIRDFVLGKRGKAKITDDTQMTLFTAEGLLRAFCRGNHKGIGPAFNSVAYHAYLRWLYTQGETSPDASFRREDFDGWLLNIKDLLHRRAPGNTCLSALKSGKMGRIDQPINNSKGCGGVMRAAPVGLIIWDEEKAFNIACELAAITHGHPSGYLAAGVFAAIIFNIIAGKDLIDAIGPRP